MKSRAVKEGVDNADLALARMPVVGTKNCSYGTCQYCVPGFQMTAMESHSCRGYRSKTRSVPRLQDSSEAPPLTKPIGGLSPSACGNLHAIVAPVGEWEGACSCIRGAFLRPLHRMTSPLHIVARVQLRDLTWPNNNFFFKYGL